MLLRTSLRLRLLVLILVPLFVAAALGLTWQYRKSAQLAEDVFDQKLSIMALAIYRDLLVTNGERLSPSTKALFEEAADSQFFYHVRGPDGGFITGYSPPPLRPRERELALNTPILFTSVHRGQPVQVVQLMERAKIDGLEGLVLVSVWQDLQQRQTLANDLALQSGLTALFLISTVCLVVVFGIRLGLRPLSSVEQAISVRSSTDLRPIRRNVPVEVRHLVRRLNKLFSDVTEEQASRDRFISNAAHQLRNPIAAIQSLAEVAQDAPNLAEAKQRNHELVDASRSLARLTEQLLSYERLRNRPARKQAHLFDPFVADILSAVANKVVDADVELSFSGKCGNAVVKIDAMLVEQALLNIIDNALVHGGDDLKTITVTTRKDRKHIYLSVCNDGTAIPASSRRHLFERFEQGQSSAGHSRTGTGLGLAIVKEICTLHQADISLTSGQARTCFKFRFKR